MVICIGIDVFHKLPLATNSSDLPYIVQDATKYIYILLPISDVLNVF